jgi:NAD(P)-dependent dehydrogenase (short-subunit alcohol dehydrogenase family)
MSAILSELASFSAETHAVVIGASGGIGAALVDLLCAAPSISRVAATSRSGVLPAHTKLTTHALDICDEANIAAVATQIDAPRLVIVATGLLQGQDISPEKSWRMLSAEAMAKSYAVNTIGPALVAKHFLPRLPRTGKAVFAALSARVGSISDNRSGGWHSYRASKAALNQIIRTCAIELALKNKEALCVGLHPGTVDTQLSAPFKANVAAEKLFTPAQSASYLLAVIDGLTPADSGGVFAWDGARIPA